MRTVYLDTETTGLRGIYAGGRDEIVEVAILDDRGKPVINQLVHPTIAAWLRHPKTFRFAVGPNRNSCIAFSSAATSPAGTPIRVSSDTTCARNRGATFLKSLAGKTTTSSERSFMQRASCCGRAKMRLAYQSPSTVVGGVVSALPKSPARSNSLRVQRSVTTSCPCSSALLHP